MKKLVPEIILQWVAIWKTEGFKSLVKKKGWKVVAAVVLFYLIRDIILYIIIPYGLYKGCI